MVRGIYPFFIWVCFFIRISLLHRFAPAKLRKNSQNCEKIIAHVVVVVVVALLLVVPPGYRGREEGHNFQARFFFFSSKFILGSENW